MYDSKFAHISCFKVKVMSNIQILRLKLCTPETHFRLLKILEPKELKAQIKYA